MGRFQKGQPRPQNQGRRAGTPNKTTRALKVVETLATSAFNPVEKILELLPQLSAAEQVKALLALQEYIEPKARVTSEQPPEEPQRPDPLLDAKDVTPQELLEAAQRKEDL